MHHGEKLYIKPHLVCNVGSASMQHLAIIMDGNRRWAHGQGLKPWLGHSHGVESIKKAVNFCLKNNIAYLSLYTFSIENFKRPVEERSYLFDILSDQVQHQIHNLIEQNIRVRFIGDRSLFPEKLKPIIEQVEQQTKHGSALNLNFLFCYGARQEIVSGIKNIIHQIKQGILSENDISDETINQSLWTVGIPEPDMIIRTGGLKRISNFLLFQSAYSELYFLDCFWPDITEHDLETACSNFKACQRNFGT